MKKPLISVVIPTYNSRRTIEKCLESIKSQDYSPIEIIVVDSLYYKRSEKEICKKIIKKYARFYEGGPERSIQRNLGIKKSKGDYILVIDQDMYLTKHVVTDCLDTMLKTKCRGIIVPEISIGEGYWTECVSLERYISTYLENALNESCRFFVKKDADAVGGYDPNLVGAEDSDFHFKIAELGKIKKIKSIIYHDEGVTDFWGRVKKKYQYSKSFKNYLKKRPRIAAAQLSPFKLAYLKHFRELVKKPHIAAGMVILRGAEVFAGGLGILIK